MNEEDSSSQQPVTPRSWFERITQLVMSSEPKTREELLDLLRNSEQRQVIDSYALGMIEGVLRVFETEVRDVMVPRAQMVVLEKNLPLEALLPIVVRSAHSRFPVIDQDKDEVVGILLAKDLLAAYFNATPFSIESLLRIPVFVPESKPLDAMLKEFRATRSHMAIVVNEYGSVSGLLTIEDVLEEIVGEIEDEYDPNRLEETYIKREAEGLYLIHALTPIDDFNEYFKSQLSNKEFDTLGGLVSHLLGHLPKKGENIRVDKFRFTVVSADNRRIRLLRMEEQS